MGHDKESLEGFWPGLARLRLALVGISIFRN